MRILVTSEKEQNGGLVNNVRELWQTVHEQCSPKSAKRGFGEQCSRTLANCSRTIFTRKPKRGFVREQPVNKGIVCEHIAKIHFVKNIQNIKIEISLKCQGRKLTRGSGIYSNQSQIFSRIFLPRYCLGMA